LRILVLIILGSAAAATALSPFSNQLLARCVATLIPVALIVVGYSVDSAAGRKSFPGARLAAAGFAFLLVASAGGLARVATTPRSNAREAARYVTQHMQSSDVLIIAPEWFAASFNRYFPPSIEQIDFPNAARSGVVDFANIWGRVSDPRRVTALAGRIGDFSKQGRRVWLVTERRYLTTLTREEIRDAQTRKSRASFSILRVAQIRSILSSSYGAADSAVLSPGRPLYDDLRVYLFSPR
jgi:hypothetical protein